MKRGTKPHAAAASTVHPWVASTGTSPRNPSPGAARMMAGEELTSTASVSRRKRRLTDSRASRGHSWNQSMATQLTMAGNLLLRTRSLLPTGEKHSATCGGKGGEGEKTWLGAGTSLQPSLGSTSHFPTTSNLKSLHFTPASLACERHNPAANTFFLCNEPN